MRTGAQAALAGAQVAQAAPAHFEEKGHFVSGLTKTVEETGGLLGGVINRVASAATVSNKNQ